jgi:hypothetical protein
MQEDSFTGRIANLVIFRVTEFGIRAKFTIEDTGRYPVVCAVEGDVAREFIASYREGHYVTVRGIYEPRPSTAAANTPWVARYRVRGMQVAEDIRLAGMRLHQIHKSGNPVLLPIDFGHYPEGRRVMEATPAQQ